MLSLRKRSEEPRTVNLDSVFLVPSDVAVSESLDLAAGQVFSCKRKASHLLLESKAQKVPYERILLFICFNFK